MKWLTSYLGSQPAVRLVLDLVQYSPQQNFSVIVSGVPCIAHAVFCTVKNEYWLLFINNAYKDELPNVLTAFGFIQKDFANEVEIRLTTSSWHTFAATIRFQPALKSDSLSYCKRFLWMSLLRFWYHIMIITAMFKKNSRLDCLLNHSLIMHTRMNCLTF